MLSTQCLLIGTKPGRWLSKFGATQIDCRAPYSVARAQRRIAPWLAYSFSLASGKSADRRKQANFSGPRFLGRRMAIQWGKSDHGKKDSLSFLRCGRAVQDDGSSAWRLFICSVCGHVTLASNPGFECACTKCRNLRPSSKYPSRWTRSCWLPLQDSKVCIMFRTYPAPNTNNSR